MGDPLSVTASIVALLQLTQAVVQGLNGMKDASKERISIRDEIIYVSGLLYNLKGQVARSEIWSGIVSSLVCPRGPLEQLKEALEQLTMRLSPAEGLRKVGKSIAWPFQKGEVEAILRRIERQKTHIVLAIENNHINLSQGIKEDISTLQNGLREIKDGVTRLQLDQSSQLREQETQDILKWMSRFNCIKQQKDLLSRTQDGTGQWLLGCQKFKQWTSGAQRLLWCSGQAGVGKTVLASIIINHLEQSLCEDEAIAYLFCNYNERVIQTAEDLLASLVHQLSLRRLFVNEELKSLYRFHIRRQTRPNLSEWSNLLQSELRLYRRVVFVIDALDECAETNGVRDDFLVALKRLQPSVHLLVTSRPLPALEMEFEKEEHIEILASDDDIRRYIDKRIDRESRLLRQIQADPPLRETIITNILSAAKGMFIVAQLHMDSVAKMHSRESICRALQTLPTKLDESYDETMKRISEQDEEDARLAQDILSWISFARRPLSVAELQHALAIEHCMQLPNWSAKIVPNFSQGNLISEDILVSVCAGLVTIDQESRIIRLVHYTAQNYLDRIRSGRFQRGQLEIALACLAYISLEEFASGYCSNDGQMEARLAKYPFLNYAARYWGNHASDVSNDSIRKLELEFLECKEKLGSAVQIMHLSVCKYPGYSQQFPKDATALQVSSAFDLEGTTKELLKRGATIAAQDKNGWTAMHRASENGHERVVELLLENGMDVNSLASHGGTALHRAAKNGHEKVMRLLMKMHAKIDVDDQYGGTALHRAAKYGHGALVRLLVDSGAEIDRKCRPEVVHKLILQTKPRQRVIHFTPTYNTAWEILSAAMDLLDKADIHSEKFSGGTAIHEAADGGHAAVVDLLISMHAAVDLTDNYGGTALHRAAVSGHDRVAELLIDAGADVNKKYDHVVVANLLEDTELLQRFTMRYILGRTPLHEAAKYGRISVMQVLLQKGADYHAYDESGFLPLHRAAEAGHEAAVALLVKKGAHIDGLNILGQSAKSSAISLSDFPGYDYRLRKESRTTPLHLAARNGHSAVVSFLLGNGATIDSLDAYEKTALHYATKKGHYAVVAMLLENGADLTIRDQLGDLAIHLAIDRRDQDITGLLLDSGQAVDSENRRGYTALTMAAGRGDQGLVQLLLQYGAQITDRDHNLPGNGGYNQSPLHAAIYSDRQVVFGMLLDQVPTLNLNTRKGMSYLVHAAQIGRIKIGEILLNRGSNPNYRDNRGQTALHSATIGKSTEFVAMLLVRGADLEIKDNEGRTPLSWAAAEGEASMAELLLESGADPNSADNNGWNPLRWAWKNQHKHLVDLLLDNGADIDFQDPSGQTLLLLAAAQGMQGKEVVHLLLKRRADPNIQDHLGRTALSEAFAQNDTDQNIIQLLEHEAIPSPNNMERERLLVWAAARGYQEAVTLLIQRGADVNATIPSKSTALVAAVQGGHAQVIKLLIESGASVNNPQNLLHQAVERNTRAVVQLLLENGANVDQKDSDGRVPVSLAVSKTELHTLRLLIEYGADTNVKDGRGGTLLSQAVRHGHIAPVQLLLEMVIEPDNGDWRGSCKNRAFRNDYIEVVHLLLDDIDKLHKEAIFNRVRHGKATGNEHRDMLKLLIREGPLFDRHEEQELLEKATAKGYTDVVELIHGKTHTQTLTRGTKSAVQAQKDLGGSNLKRTRSASSLKKKQRTRFAFN